MEKENKVVWYYTATYRQWKGKPDPYGWGKYNVESTDLPWLRENRLRDSSFGHRVGRIRKKGQRS